MLRFILNFFLFGILFFMIYLFLPETFATLVSWASKTYEFFREIFLQISERISPSRNHVPVKEMLGLISRIWI